MKKWLTEWCNSYSFIDENEKPTIKKFFIVLFKKVRGWSPIYRTRMLVQRIFRLNHLADCDIWEAQGTIARKILPVLKAYKKMKRHGYPNIYSEWDEHSGFTKEEYDTAVKEGTMLGGSEKAWEADLDHMIHATEYIAWEGSSKKITKWYIDNFGKDPYAKNDDNKYFYYTYKCKNGNSGMTFNGPPIEEVTDLKKHETYGNSELLNKIDEYVSEGTKKFGNRWQALWD